MTIDELRSMFPKTYQEAFNRGVQAERAKHLAAGLIVGAEPDEVHPAIFAFGRNQKAAKAKSVRTRWLFLP
jgi:hypothetical protein